MNSVDILGFHELQSVVTNFTWNLFNSVNAIFNSGSTNIFNLRTGVCNIFSYNLLPEHAIRTVDDLEITTNNTGRAFSTRIICRLASIFIRSEHAVVAKYR